MKNSAGLKLIIVWSIALAGACGGGAGGGDSSPTSPSTSTGATGGPTGGSSTSSFPWNFNGSIWQASGTAEACPNPFVLSMPVDITKVTSVLYPGQTRGEYKPHGGFRFDGTGQTNDVAVRAPFSGMALRGSRYFVQGTEIQYSIDVMHPCGMMFRFGHLRELTGKFQALADTLPAPSELDSRTTNFTPGTMLTDGELIATAVGVRTTANVFVDWGVYDLRQRNASSADPAWLAAHPGDVAPFAICWFDMLTPANTAIVRALPSADGQMGRTSDFCR